MSLTSVEFCDFFLNISIKGTGRDINDLQNWFPSLRSPPRAVKVKILDIINLLKIKLKL